MQKPSAKSDWKDGFLFVGNQLALDFLNTRPLVDGKLSELLADLHAVLRWFRAANLLTAKEFDSVERQWSRTDRAHKTVQALHELREKLREEILAWEQGRAIHQSTVGLLNNLMANHPMRTRLTHGRNAPSIHQWFEVRQPEDLFAPLAHSAAALFSTADQKRVRKCAQCVLHFQDTSKKGTRRWCSMQLCGNRWKVAAYAARQREVNASEGNFRQSRG
jgi:predicted RNA-binding Zn ribbon-like protein